MTGDSWVNRVCELEEEGRFDEARALIEANNTPAEREAFEVLFETLAEALGRIKPDSVEVMQIDPGAIDEIEFIMKQFRAARTLPPDDHRRQAWESRLHETPSSVSPILEYLPDLLKRRGRPPGTSIFSDEQFVEMDRRVRAGENPKRVAKDILGEAPNTQPRSRPDYFVKEWKKRGKNSD